MGAMCGVPHSCSCFLLCQKRKPTLSTSNDPGLEPVPPVITPVIDQPVLEHNVLTAL